MELVENFLTENPCYKTNRKIEVKGFMLHSVGCAQPNASVFLKNWNKSSYDRACVHGFIDANSGVVYQCLPWNHRGWHAGGSANNTHVGVEMCESKYIKYTSGAKFTVTDYEKALADTRRTYAAAVELVAMICEKYSLNPLANGVVVSHSEGHKLGIASGHADPEHLWNQLKTGYTMDGFRKDVAAKMGKVVVVKVDSTIKESVIAKPQAAKYKDANLKGSFKTLANISLRMGAGDNNYPAITDVPKDTVVKCYGYYNKIGDEKWCYVQYKDKSGYISEKNLKKV